MKLINTIGFLALLGAYDNGAPGWKLDSDGHMVLKDGNPVYVDVNGREQTVGGDTISNLRKEAQTNRERAESAETKLKVFDGLDPEIARKAVETVGKIDAKKLIDAGEVDKVRDQIKTEFTKQIEEKDKGMQSLQSRIDNMLVDGIFSNSNFVRENIAVPSDMFQSYFRNNFKVEDGKITAYGKDGNRLLSKAKAGEYADAEEALQILVESHPQKDVILKANLGTGTGSSGGGGSRGTGRVIKRGEFDKLGPVQKAEISKKVSAGEMTLTD